MASYVGVSDEGAARAAAARLVELGERLGTGHRPPVEYGDTEVWGDDRYGQAMLQNYPAETVEACVSQRQQVSARMSEIGDGVVGALREATGQDRVNAGEIDGVVPPVR